MNEIKTQTRPSFFPQSKDARAKKLQKARAASLLKRNDATKTKELLQATERDAKVQIPGSIREFSRIRKAVDHAPERDQSEKIARLKRSIAGGTYQVDYDALANKLLDQQF